MSEDRLHELVRRQAESNPDAVAILGPGREPITYGQLWRQITTIAATLNGFGIAPGDRVAAILPEGPEAAVALLGIAAAATCAPLNPACRAGEFEFHLSDLNAKALVAPSGSVSPAMAVARSLGIPIVDLYAGKPAAGHFAEAGDIALALHTSGSAARPKLAPLTHRNLCTAAHHIRCAIELTAADRCLVVMPLFHIHGLSTIFASLAAGASVVCTPGFAVESFFSWLEEFQPTWYSAAPAIHQAILDRTAQRAPSHSSLRFLRSASSAMPRQLAEDLERVFQVPVIEAYGMTEAGPQIASNRLPPHPRKPGSVGQAAGPEISILNDTGEIVIRGSNVIERYARPADANETAFVDGWFRTGDIGHLDADGHLFITGRIKEIINRGGEKISPREVDEVLLEHPGVAQAATFPLPHPSLGETVAAAIVLRSGAMLTAAEIRQFAAARLAYFKTPRKIAIVDEIPRGSTGKIERSRLAAQLGLIGDSSPFLAPRTTVEKILAEIWASVLRVDTPGIHDDFFESGGDSLIATQFVARVRSEFGTELAMESVFARPTIAELAELISGSDGRRRPNIPRRADPETMPLSFAQERLWFLDQMSPGNAAYNVSSPLRLDGALDPAALAPSLDEIRRRHETLRSTFRTVDGQPVLSIAPAQPAELPTVDLTESPDREAKAMRLAEEDAARPFDLERGPLFRATLVRLGSTEHVLLLSAHHIVTDGWSTGVLYRELAALYEAFRTGAPHALPDLPVQYTDFAAWQRECLRGETLENQLAWWKEQLRGAPTAIEIPLHRARPCVERHRGSKKQFTIPRPLAERLKAIGLGARVTPFMAWMAAFQTLLFRYTGQEDLLVGIPIANRTRTETEWLAGFFANTLVLRGNLAGNPTFRELLDRVRATAQGAYAHQDLPFEKLVDELRPERDPGRMPLVQVMFAFQNLPDSAATTFPLGPGLTARPFKVDGGVAKFDLTLYLSENAEGLEGTWQYNTGLFEPGAMERMTAHFRTLVESIAANPDQRVAELPLLDKTERHRIEIEWNRTAAPPVLDGCFHHLFEQQVERAPSAVAVECGDERITYVELNARANQLAQRLRELGVGPESRVGISLPRSTAMLIALLGVMKAGGAYLPLDPEYPAERLAFMMRDAGARVLVTEQSLLAALRPDPEVSLLCLEAVSAGDQRNLDGGASSRNLAYVIYTSGSTGRPKGVMLTHANLCHCAQAMAEATGVAPGDRYLHTASFSFSSSVRQFAVPLTCGATVVLALSDQVRDPRALLELIRARRVSLIDVVPSYWRTCIQAMRDLPEDERAILLDNDLRLVLSASERLSPELANQTAALGHRARVMNMYGQTETTGIVTVYPVDSAGAEAAAIPIGRPIANTRAYVLDAGRKTTPIGVTGELYIGGAGLARGYLNHPELTADRFVPDPFCGSRDSREAAGQQQDLPRPQSVSIPLDGPGASAADRVPVAHALSVPSRHSCRDLLPVTQECPAPPAVLYRTGDRARYLPDGNIEFLGRADDQIKVRGFRVEPQEIESALREHPWVWESAVAAQGSSSQQRLVAFVIPRERVQPERLTAELRDFLKRKLPDYMTPAVIAEVESLPLTANGKLDRRALADRAVPNGKPKSNGHPKTFVPPQGPVEETLAAIWRETLHVDRVGVDDNFFDLGGDSLLSVGMIARANQAGLELSLKQLFEHQTIAELAQVARSPKSRPASVEPAADEPVIRVTLDSLRAYGREALERAGMTPEGAAIVTEVQLEASLRGQPTHNVDSIPRYARRILAGAMNPRPHIRIEHETPVSVQMDGDNGPGQWVAMTAMETAIRKARAGGIGMVSVRRSNHFGAAGHYVWMAARQGLIGVCTTNGPVILAPAGGVTPTFGNNPLGVGIPAGRYHPILLDMAMSVAPRGKIGLQLAEGKPLPTGWILDKFGRPSTDPADLAAGLGVPIGGHKGYGLALVMETLAGVLTGAGFCTDHRREQMRDASEPRDLGHFFLVIDPALFSPLSEFTARVDRMIELTKSGERAPGVDEILIPGESELRARERNLSEGVPLRPATHRALRKYGQTAGLRAELAVID